MGLGSGLGLGLGVGLGLGLGLRLGLGDGAHEGGVAEECRAIVRLQVPQLDLAVGGTGEERVAVDVQAAHLVAG